MASSVRRRGRPGATSGCYLAPVRQRWPHWSSRQCCHGCHATPHSPSALPLALPLSLASPTAEAPSPLPSRASRAPRALAFASCHLSGRLWVHLELHLLLHLLAARDFPEVSRISQDFRRRVHDRCDPTPANLAAAPSMPPFFCLSHVRASLGECRGLCHTIPSLVAPSSGNTVAMPPRSPPTTTLHVSRLVGAVSVRPFYLGSSALSH